MNRQRTQIKSAYYENLAKILAMRLKMAAMTLRNRPASNDEVESQLKREQNEH